MYGRSPEPHSRTAWPWLSFVQSFVPCTGGTRNHTPRLRPAQHGLGLPLSKISCHVRAGLGTTLPGSVPHSMALAVLCPKFRAVYGRSPEPHSPAPSRTAWPWLSFVQNFVPCTGGARNHTPRLRPTLPGQPIRLMQSESLQQSATFERFLLPVSDQSPTACHT